MRIKVGYGGISYDVGDTPDNRDALREVGQVVAEGRSEVLILELSEGGTATMVVGPAIPLAVSYLEV